MSRQPGYRILEPAALAARRGIVVTAAVISSCRELNPGDEISATYNGTLVHHGRVTDLAPDLSVFWIMDYVTGGRRLIDMAEMGVTRIPAKNAA
jgi:hypothetical protein